MTLSADDGFNWNEEELLFADVVSAAEGYFSERGLVFEPEEKARLLMALFRLVRDRRYADKADRMLGEIVTAHSLGTIGSSKNSRR